MSNKKNNKILMFLMVTLLMLLFILINFKYYFITINVIISTISLLYSINEDGKFKLEFLLLYIPIINIIFFVLIIFREINKFIKILYKKHLKRKYKIDIDIDIIDPYGEEDWEENYLDNKFYQWLKKIDNKLS